jgi:PAS domain S-box-containing protein
MISENLSKKNTLEILIVDDSMTDRTIFQRYLSQDKSSSYKFREVESIREAMELIAVLTPDCVLLDYDLPDGNGTDFIDQINALYGRNCIPVVMLSGVESIEVALQTIERGAQDFLVKNRATAADLVRAVDNAIDKVWLYRERQSADEKIRVSEEKYRQLFNSMDEGFCVIEMIFDEHQKAVDYRFLEVNAAFEKQTGLQNAGGELVSKLVPDLEKSWFEIYEKVALTGNPVRIDNRVAGLNRWHDVYAFRFGDASERQVAVVFNDISERRQAEEKIRESEQNLATLAQTLPQLVWMSRPDGYIFWYNRNWYDYTGTQPEQMENEGWKAVHDPEILPQVISRWQYSLETGAPFEMEFPLRRHDGQFRWFLTRVNPLRDANGEIIRWFGTNTDIEEMRQMRIQAENANRLKDDFLATLSHELRTPLNAILGWSQIVRTRKLGETEMQNALSIIDRSARAQKQLIEDILDVSRIITGKFRLDVQAIDLIKVITAAIETARPGAEAKNIRLQMLLDPEATNISGDPDRLQQVVWNLLSNAVKFTPKNGRIQVRLERINSHVEITVSDTGKGIEAEFLPFIFDRFRQFDGSMTRRQGGLGLGLALVRQIVELHGGTVSVDSKGRDLGAVFSIHLPLLPLRVEPLSDVPRVHPEAEEGFIDEEIKADLTGLRILIVDDEADSREMLRLTLENRGANIVSASSAAQALKAFEAEKFDLLISDIGMPDEDGFSLIKKIRKLPVTNGGKTPALALTAYARAEDRIKALQSGFQMHISKPIDLSELTAVVASMTNADKG